MTVTISCVNLKGGVGKTALATNLAAYAGRRGLTTLLVDLDPQTNATFSCMTVDDWHAHSEERGSVADILGARREYQADGTYKDASDVRVEGVFKNVDLVPSHLDLFTVDLDLAAAIAREQRLAKGLDAVRDEYDVIICDCPPNLTLPTQNALAASTHYVIPTSLDFLSVLGIPILQSRLRTLCRELQNPLTLTGIVMTRVGRPSYHRLETKSTLRTQFPEDLIDTEIKERSAVSEAVQRQQSVFDYAPRSDAADEFKSVCQSILTKAGAIE